MVTQISEKIRHITTTDELGSHPFDNDFKIGFLVDSVVRNTQMNPKLFKQTWMLSTTVEEKSFLPLADYGTFRSTIQPNLPKLLKLHIAIGTWLPKTLPDSRCSLAR